MQPRIKSNAGPEQPPRRRRRFRLAGLACTLSASMLAATCLEAQIEPPPGGFHRGGPNVPDPAEMGAYRSALGQANPIDRVTALQQFIASYPRSSFRQPAISALMAAQREMQTGQSAPAMPIHPVPTQPRPAPVPAPAAPGVPAAEPKDSLLQHAPRQAQISVAPHRLEIKADNSALSQILRDIAGTSGMKIDGLSKDERIFGTYGPGEAREVLLSLLEGSGYNVVMIGDLATGTPRELSLTQRVAAANAGPSAPSRANPEDESEETDQDVQQAPPQSEATVPPQNAPNGNDPAQPRSPQEIMQELQRLRQQSQPPPQNPQ
jgi:hypothetical protein